MKNRPHKNILISGARKFLCIAFFSGILALGTIYVDVAEAIETSFLYTLSNFNGTVPYQWATIFADKKRDEIYVLYQNSVSVYNPSGMEIYRFGDDIDLGHIVDAAVDHTGDILMLVYRDSGYKIYRCNFRGDPVGVIEIKNLPPEFSEFSPTRITCQDGNLYLANLIDKKIIVTTSDGKFETGYDIASILDLSPKEKKDSEMMGFSVNADGDILFTIPVFFKAYKLSSDRKIEFFGRPGGAPGNFGIISGIVSDSRGNYLIADKLKSAVIVFDKNQNFLEEFGFRGLGPGNLIAPNDLVIDSQNRVYVTQGRRRGVSVFKITYP